MEFNVGMCASISKTISENDIVDNDDSKVNCTLDGHRIVSPEVVSETEYDRIIILVYK